MIGPLNTFGWCIDWRAYETQQGSLDGASFSTATEKGEKGANMPIPESVLYGQGVRLCAFTCKQNWSSNDGINVPVVTMPSPAPAPSPTPGAGGSGGGTPVATPSPTPATATGGGTPGGGTPGGGSGIVGGGDPSSGGTPGGPGAGNGNFSQPFPVGLAAGAGGGVGLCCLLTLIGLLLMRRRKKKGDGDLPANWEKVVGEDGKAYYHNAKTGNTSWEKPRGNQTTGDVEMGTTGLSAVGASADNDTPWSEARTDSGESYWYNETTGATTWENPQAGVGGGGAGDGGGGEWEELTTEGGEAYRYNETTGETKWSNNPMRPPSNPRRAISTMTKSRPISMTPGATF